MTSFGIVHDIDEASTPPATPPRLRTILRRLIAHAPQKAKRFLRIATIAWLGVIVLQLWDVAGRAGPAVAAELLSVIFGSLGFVVLGAAHVLHTASRSVADGRNGSVADRVDPAALDEVLIALPLLAFASGVMFTAAVGATIARFAFGGELPIVVLTFAVYGNGLLFAALTVANATRLLAEHVEAHAGALERARADATDAHLAALRAQMDPHFLFNALNTVASLVRTDARVAESTVENLSNVLRRTLERSHTATSTLADEVDYVRSYLEVERTRWGDRLMVRWSVPGSLGSIPVPSMTLQPLVENALKHGLGPRSSGGTIAIDADWSGGTLRLTVTDDGIGLPARHREGIGLANLRQRLEAIYEGLASLRLEKLDGGTRAVVEVPISGGRFA